MVVNGPQPLAVQSSIQTPPEKRNLMKKKNNAYLSLMSMKERTEHSQNVARPESKAQFMNLDFVQRCAVAGLQLGKTKVFLRREAFDRIEAMRSQKIFGSAVFIQAMVRGKICREHYKRMRWAAIRIQSVLRIKLSQNRLVKRRREIKQRLAAAIAIQRAYRDARFRKQNNNFQQLLSHAASIIQARVRFEH